LLRLLLRTPQAEESSIFLEGQSPSILGRSPFFREIGQFLFCSRTSLPGVPAPLLKELSVVFFFPDNSAWKFLFPPCVRRDTCRLLPLAPLRACPSGFAPLSKSSFFFFFFNSEKSQMSVVPLGSITFNFTCIWAGIREELPVGGPNAISLFFVHPSAVTSLPPYLSGDQ